MNAKVNLLPEAKLLKLRAQAQRHFYGGITGLICGIVAAVIIVLIMLQVFLISTYQLNQNKIADLRAGTAKEAAMEQSASTLQEHLQSSYTLNQNRLYASKIFTNLSNTIPSGVSLNTFQISKDNVVTVSGTASSFAEVASFAKALEEYNVNYKPQPNLDRKPLFSTVSITALSKDTNTNKVNFTMSFKTDTMLFKKSATGAPNNG